MPRNNNANIDGATALGLSAIDELEGVEEVPQHKLTDVVIDFTKAAKVLIPDGTEAELEIKGQRFGYTKKDNWPKLSFMYMVNNGDYEGETFFDDMLFIPAIPPKKGTMWRVNQFAESVGYKLPSSLAGDEIVPWIKQFGEEMLGEQLRAVIGIQTSDQVNPTTGEVYEPRNVIKKFIRTGSRSLDDLFS